METKSIAQLTRGKATTIQVWLTGHGARPTSPEQGYWADKTTVEHEGGVGGGQTQG